MKKIITQFKREFWEHRGTFVRAPLYLGSILLGLVLLGVITAQSHIGSAKLHIDMKLSAQGEHEIDTAFLRQLMSGELFSAHPEILGVGLAAIYTVFILVLWLVLGTYLLGTLYNDRRDQSILFWKSLPVTERQNVVTKLGMAVVGAPLVYGAAAVATGAFYLLVLMSYAGLFLGLPLPGFGQVLGAFVGSIASLVFGWLLLALWVMPLFCWLLFSSALAKKVPFLLALGIPVALSIVEIWVLGSSHLGGAIKYQLSAGIAAIGQVLPFPGEIGRQLSDTLSAPAFWGGLVAGGVMLAGCVWLRNYRYEV